MKVSEPTTPTTSLFKYAEQGNRLKQLRLSRGMSQSELSRLAQISMSTLVKLERGERVPGTEVKERLAAALVLAPGGAGGQGEARTDVEGETVASTKAETKAEKEEGLAAIDWPAPYAAESYNHRQPFNAAPGSPGDRLKQLRLAQGVTQAEIAWRLGMTEQKYGRIERGYSKQVSRTVLEKLTIILGEGVMELEFSILP